MICVLAAIAPNLGISLSVPIDRSPIEVCVQTFLPGSKLTGVVGTAWKGLLPKLIPILQENRQYKIDCATLERRVNRRKCVDDFLSQMRGVHPFRSLLDALGPGHRSFFHTLMENPFPKTKTALKWECLNDLGEREISIEQVKAELAERKDQIEQTILNWRSDIERRLVERFESGNKRCRDEVVVTVSAIDETHQSCSN